jgi:hypothetical protein
MISAAKARAGTSGQISTKQEKFIGPDSAVAIIAEAID